jgi:hypothetical protein
MTHPSTRQLERLVVGEVVAGDVDAHVESCERCRDFVAQHDRDREQLLARWPADVFVARVATRRNVQRRRTSFAIAAGGVALAAALVIVAGFAFRTAEETGGGVRLKGVGIEVFRRRGDRVEPLASDARVRSGDGLRIRVTLPAPDSVSVSFVDAAGHVDRFGAASIALTAGENLLPGAVVVDTPCLDLRLVVRTSLGELSRSLRCE